MKQYFNISDNNCPTCGGSTTRTNVLFLDGMIRVDSTCNKCGHSLMTLYQIESVVDDDEPAVSTNVSVTAELMHEKWVRDYAYYVDSEYFDCCKALDEFGLSELPPSANGFVNGWLNYGDEVFATAVILGIAKDWDGPFTLAIDSDDYDEYIRQRVLNEYGKEVRQ